MISGVCSENEFGASRLEAGVDFKEVGDSSAKLMENRVDPYIFRIVDELDFSGEICDLGCGIGSKLLSLCKLKKTNGWGIDQSQEAIAFAKELHYDEDSVQFHVGDIREIKTEFPKVEMVLLCSVFHDLNEEEECLRLFQSFDRLFPNLKYVVIFDTVASSGEMREAFAPGFTFLHGLQGFIPRDYKSTIRLLKQLKYQIVSELKTDFPSSYVWVLQSKN